MGPALSLVLQSPVRGLGDLMRLVCGLSTLRLFKADLKISGWCYYTSKEEEATGLAFEGSYCVAAPGLARSTCRDGLGAPERLVCLAGHVRRDGQEGGSGNRVPTTMRCNLASGLGRPHVYAIQPPGQKTCGPGFCGKGLGFPLL